MGATEKVEKGQVICAIRVLFVVAGADGVIRDEERRPLDACLRALGLDGDQIDELWDEAVDLESMLDAVRNDSLRCAVIRAAHALARVDGIVPEELAIIERAQDAWGWGAEAVERALEELLREDRTPMHADPAEQAAHLERLLTSWVLALADLALEPDEVEARRRGRRTDISELARRFMRGEATAVEVAFKFKEDIGES